MKPTSRSLSERFSLRNVQWSSGKTRRNLNLKYPQAPAPSKKIPSIVWGATTLLYGQHLTVSRRQHYSQSTFPRTQLPLIAPPLNLGTLIGANFMEGVKTGRHMTGNWKRTMRKETFWTLHRPVLIILPTRVAIAKLDAAPTSSRKGNLMVETAHSDPKGFTALLLGEIVSSKCWSFTPHPCTYNHGENKTLQDKNVYF